MEVGCSKEVLLCISVNIDEGQSDSMEDESPSSVLWNMSEYMTKNVKKSLVYCSFTYRIDKTNIFSAERNRICSGFTDYLTVHVQFVHLEFKVVLFFFFDVCFTFRTCFRGLPNPPARQRLLTLPPSLRHVPLQLCVLPALPLQHEGEHGNVWGSSEGEDIVPAAVALHSSAH